MSEIKRFGVSIDENLLEEFDELVEGKGYGSRSEAIRDLIREELIKKEWSEDEEVVGVITLLYDHHAHGLSDKLTELQHDSYHLVISTTHVHLDHDNCLEFMAVKGKGSEVKDLTYKLTSLKGVKHGKLTGTSTGEELD